MEFETRRRIAQSHSTYLRSICANKLCPLDPKRPATNLLDVFQEKVLGTFLCTAEDNSEKRLEKYFENATTRLPRVEGQHSIVSSLEQFRKNLNAFSGGQLRHLNWKNVLVKRKKREKNETKAFKLFIIFFFACELFPFLGDWRCSRRVSASHSRTVSESRRSILQPRR